MKNLNNITGKIKTLGLAITCILCFSCSHVFAGEFPVHKKSTSTAVELEIKIENWMMNLAKWKTSSITALDAVDMEEEMNIKKWMLNANDFCETTFESELELEDWMLYASKKNWSANEQEEFEVENWMTDLNCWK